MKTNYRKLFIKSIADIKDQQIQKLANFTMAKPIPCWGGIYKKACKLNLDIKQKQSLIDVWIGSNDCSRFIGLLLYMNRRDEPFINLLINYYNQLPDISSQLDL